MTKMNWKETKDWILTVFSDPCFFPVFYFQLVVICAAQWIKDFYNSLAES